MNQLEFKRHLKDLVHGHHHPEEHDWSSQPATTETRQPAAQKPARRRQAKKGSTRK